MVLSFSMRLPHWGLSFAAGLAAAIAFLTGSWGALGFILSNFAPLPLMAASLGWGGSTGIIASCIAAISIGVLADLRLALEFIGLIALPSLVLAQLAQWRQGTENRFYPLPRLLAWISWAAIFGSMIDISIWASRNGGYEKATADVAAHLEPAFQNMVAQGLQMPSSISTADLAGIFAYALPYLSTVLQVLFFCISLWLAARLVDSVGQLQRRMPNLPSETALPVHVAFIGGGALALFLIGNALPSLSLMVVAGMIFFGLLTAYALEGLAVLHFVTRSVPFRGLLLTIVYFGVLFLSFWPLAIAAGVGLTDSLYPLRRNNGSADQSNA